MGIYGQDWSSYQPSTPDTSGLAFAFVKVTEGLNYVNPRWVAQRDHAKAAGLVWGAYHYPHMGNSVQAEADYFLSQVSWKPGDLVVLDWEGYDAANAGVSRGTQAAYKDAWLKYVKSKLPNNRVGMYCNTDYWRNVDTTSYYGDFLWIATAGRAAGDPGIQADWLFHQYSDSGVDRDYCHLSSLADLKAWALIQEADMPLTQADIAAVASAVWNYNEPGPDPKKPVRVGAVMGWMDTVHSNQNAALAKAVAEGAAAQSALSALAAAVGKAGGLTADQVTAAAQAGAAAALKELGHALDGTKP
ncbi:glycoside hydrolase family 25 protein [Streptomyces yunnanensis]|uniref:Glycosyl hydrolases family 25 n=1 Tax=Streptomyces yunnanensis TaxID=156453 RepID=A0A9X8QSE4_9ACTN|nr:glycoside hydrolase family 25 protein [Streptomyces yunnanensis]SHL76105.1 Glycosyl hydrolases family 25 [Streptomyces yunnanensis]